MLLFNPYPKGAGGKSSNDPMCIVLQSSWSPRLPKKERILFLYLRPAGGQWIFIAVSIFNTHISLGTPTNQPICKVSHFTNFVPTHPRFHLYWKCVPWEDIIQIGFPDECPEALLESALPPGIFFFLSTPIFKEEKNHNFANLIGLVCTTCSNSGLHTSLSPQSKERFYLQNTNSQTIQIRARIKSTF